MTLQHADRPGALAFVNSFNLSFRFKGDEVQAWPNTPANEIAVQALLDSYTLEQAKDFLKQSVAEAAFEVREREASKISSFEAGTWPLKYSEAKAYSQSQQSSDAPLLSLEAQTSGEALASLADRVLAKASQQHAREAAIAGLERALKNQISSFTWEQAKAFRIENVDWS